MSNCLFVYDLYNIILYYTILKNMIPKLMKPINKE